MSIAFDIAKRFEQLETQVNFSWYFKEGERMLNCSIQTKKKCYIIPMSFRCCFNFTLWKSLTLISFMNVWNSGWVSKKDLQNGKWTMALLKSMEVLY
jgi:hypothetical protein